MTNTTTAEMKTSVTHIIKKSDRRRIRCQHSLGTLAFCGRPTLVGEHREWNTGNTRGVSFYYYCRTHANAHGLPVPPLSTEGVSRSGRRNQSLRAR